MRINRRRMNTKRVTWINHEWNERASSIEYPVCGKYVCYCHMSDKRFNFLMIQLNSTINMFKNQLYISSKVY